MKVGPQYSAIDVFGYVQEVMMVVPVDTKINKTHHVTKKHRPKWTKRCQTRIVRSAQFEHHDGDDDCDNAIAEGF